MSRKSRTTLILQMSIPLPPDTKVPALLTWIKESLAKEAASLGDGTQAVQTNEITLALKKRETVYF